VAVGHDAHGGGGMGFHCMQIEDFADIIKEEIETNIPICLTPVPAARKLKVKVTL
jgi:hypothetical protein